VPRVGGYVSAPQWEGWGCSFTPPPTYCLTTLGLPAILVSWGVRVLDNPPHSFGPRLWGAKDVRRTTPPQGEGGGQP